jgi:hypothetical protein
MSKQDRQGARTISEFQQRYSLGKTFAQTLGIAEEARILAEETKENIDGVVEDSLKDLLAGNIDMAGKLTNTAEVFIEPDEAEIDTIYAHYYGQVTIPTELLSLYDFNNDGVVDGTDAALARLACSGKQSLATWSGAKKTPVTLTIDMSNPEKIIHITGKNMWGREVSKYIGANFTSVKNPEVEERLSALEDERVVEYGAIGDWNYRVWRSGAAECWGRVTCTVTTTDHSAGICCHGLATPIYFPADFFLFEPIVTYSLHGDGYMHASTYSVNVDSLTLSVSTEWALTNSEITCWVHARGRKAS